MNTVFNRNHSISLTGPITGLIYIAVYCPHKCERMADDRLKAANPFQGKNPGRVEEMDDRVVKKPGEQEDPLHCRSHRDKHWPRNPAQ